jgi:hypothetical protein
LNAGRLPPGYYAMAEQIAGGLGPDVLTLEGPIVSSGDDAESAAAGESGSGAATVAVAERPPKVDYRATADLDRYAQKANVVAIRHASNHRVVAMIEIVSPGNKNARHALKRFISKAEEVLDAGIHLMIVDLIPPGTFDPRGVCAAIWDDYFSDPFTPPPDKPLTLAAFVGGPVPEAYIQSTAVGQTLIDMPLFLDPDEYVSVPLQSTYQSAWEAVPAVWQRVLEKLG